MKLSRRFFEEGQELRLATVRALPGRLSGFSVPHSKSVLYGAAAFVWARRTLDRFPARAVPDDRGAEGASASRHAVSDAGGRQRGRQCARMSDGVNKRVCSSSRIPEHVHTCTTRKSSAAYGRTRTSAAARSFQSYRGTSLHSWPITG